MALIEVENLSKHYPIKKGLWSKTVGYVQALNGVSFSIEKGEILGIVGESGCGKSTLGKLLLKLITSTDGSVNFNGLNLDSIKGNELRSLRQKMQIVFQNPYSSLNPRMKIRDIISEPLQVHKFCKNNSELKERVNELLSLVGLNENFLDRYPHELSGGQRQRIAIARAISLNPEFIVLDEPVSALDVSVQAQILNLLLDLHQKLNLTYLFISHDLAVIRYISTKIGVMYLGGIVEFGNKIDIIQTPKHPYTKALLSAAPKIGGDKKNRIILHGDLPNPANLPTGCTFRTRCPIVQEKCAREKPTLKLHGSQLVSCYFID